MEDPQKRDGGPAFWLFKATTSYHRNLSTNAFAVIVSLFTVFVALAIVSVLFPVFSWLWLSMFGVNAFPDIFAALSLASLVTFPIAFAFFSYNIRIIRSLDSARETLRENAKRLEEADRMKSIFLASTSHEIRTPLNGILGMAELLKRGELGQEQREQVSVLLDASHSLTALLTDILDVSKVEAGHLELNKAPADLQKIIGDNQALWTAQGRLKGLVVHTETEGAIPKGLLCDGDRVRQCLNNLTSNAIKFTESGAVKILVRTEEISPKRWSVVLSVSDTGPGIDPNDQAKLFQPFVQLGDAASRKGGTGLGLAISRQLARLMNGDILIESAPGEGATFSFQFVADEVELPPEPTLAETHTGRKYSLLVVDDTATNRMVARLLLQGEGHDVVAAASGSEALEKMAEARFDAVLMDIHMPGLNGLETLDRIRSCEAEWSETPVIALTADAMANDRDRYMAHGMDGYAVKPINLPSLVSEIVSVVERR